MSEDNENKPAHDDESLTVGEHHKGNRHANVAHDEASEDAVHDDQNDASQDDESPNTDSSTAEPSTTPTPDSSPVPAPKRRGLSNLLSWLKRHKVWASVLAVIVLLVIVVGVPWTRLQLAGLFLKQTIMVSVIDTQTSLPITSATVADGNVHAVTDNHGQARLHVAVGSATLQISKAYYQMASVHTTVPILKPKHAVSAKLVATGRQVPVTVVDKLSGKAVENAVLSAAGSQVKTDAKGQATIVLPADKTTVTAAVTSANYNTDSVTVQVTTAAVAANTFQLTPAGHLYFLSNLNGKIDVVKTGLDGSNRQTVLAGTSSEDPQNTILLATRDWKYLALLSKRDGGSYAKLFLIDTSTDKLTTMDQGTAQFTPVGWQGHTFVYLVNRILVNNWQSGQTALKSYNADNGALKTIDQTTASGTSDSDYVSEQYDGVYILGGLVVYAKEWVASYYDTSQLNGKQETLNSASCDGSGKKIVQSFSLASESQPSIAGLLLRPYDANGLYVDFSDTTGDHYYTYDDGTLKPSTTLTRDQFEAAYPTYLLSPSGNQTFWSEPRDGKNTLFVGNNDGQNGKQIATLSDYNAYGWFTDNYLLVSKDGSELYAMSTDGSKVTKVSDYYKPARSYYGYGSGYGGL